MLLRAVPLTPFSFDQVKASQEDFVFPAMQLDTCQYTHGTVGVRIQSIDIAEVGAVLDVKIGADGSTIEDPGTNYIDTNTWLATFSFTSTTTAPYFATLKLAEGRMGGRIFVMIAGRQAGTIGNVNATIGVDITLTA